MDLDAVRGEVLHVLKGASSLLAQLHHRAEHRRGRHDRRQHVRLLHVVERPRLRHLRGVVHADDLLAADDPELHVGRGGDELEVELPLQPLLDDVHVQEAEETATEPEPECLRRLRFVDEGGVRELQPVQGVAQHRVVTAFGRVQAAPHHRLRLAVAGEGLGGRP